MSHNFGLFLKSVMVDRKSLDDLRRHFLAMRFFVTTVHSVTAFFVVIAVGEL